VGRLFWKIFAGFWITLLLTVLGVAAALTIRNEALSSDERNLAEGPHSDYAISITWLVFRHGGVDALRSLVENWHEGHGKPPLVVDQNDKDIVGRAVPPDSLREARERLRKDPKTRNVRAWHDAKGANYTIFLPTDHNDKPEQRLLPPPHIEAPIALALVAIIASLGVSALLARHFSRPIRKLQNAFQAASNGQLDVRVAQSMGTRRDEIGDLGREFDGMAQHLQQLVGSQNRLLHDVSHELRSPLARLQVAVGLARQNPAQIDTVLSRVEREAERLNALVGEILTLSRLEAQNVAHADDYVDIAELLASVVDDARFETEGSGRSLVFTNTFDGEIVIRARGELLHRAVENVIRNALRHTADKCPVEIHLGRSTNVNHLMITVADSGPGVPEEELASIFDPFFRSESTTGGGYGLGLAIARRAVEAHGGHMHAHNRGTGGLEVNIELPIDPAPV
jgi:two-component system, OmpR family, sensor kinase